MCIKLQPHRLLTQLEQAKQQNLIHWYIVKHAVGTDSYIYPRAMITIQLHSDTTDRVIDQLCQHIEKNYTVRVWNREYITKIVTLAYMDVDHYGG